MDPPIYFRLPLIGAISQRFNFPLGPKQQVDPDLLQRGLFSSSRARSDERPAKVGSENAKAPWPEAKEQQLKGRPFDPFRLAFSSSSTCAVGARKLNKAFRFGGHQGEKLRAFDDLKRPLANLACSVLTPTMLASWATWLSYAAGPARPPSTGSFPKLATKTPTNNSPKGGSLEACGDRTRMPLLRKMVRLLQPHHGLRGRRGCTTL